MDIQQTNGSTIKNVCTAIIYHVAAHMIFIIILVFAFSMLSRSVITLIGKILVPHTVTCTLVNVWQWLSPTKEGSLDAKAELLENSMLDE